MSVAEILRQAIERGEVNTSSAEWKVINDILRCRTPQMGGHLYECKDCGKEIPVYNSCRNRHCPKCQGEGSARWLEARTKELLPVPYFHLVFTVPHELNGIFLQNKALLFGILFRSVAKTLKEVAESRLGGSLGFFSVLHSWGKKLDFHPHIHTVVPGVILKNDTIEIAPENYLLPKNVLSAVFRAVFIKELVRAFLKGKLSFFGNQEYLKDSAAFFSLIRAVKEKHWITYAKKPFAGPSAVLKYLALYTHRVAISEKRILCVKDGSVSFTYKDYADNCAEKVLTLSVGEFTRRFLQHVLPKAFVKIRYFGFLAPGKRKNEMARVQTHFLRASHITLLPLKSRACPYCKSTHLQEIKELPKLSSFSSSSNAHKTKVLPLVA